jgi:hypothetical protein
MYYFEIPSFKMRAYEACLIKCHTNNQQWCYTKKNSYEEDALAPNVSIYQVKELDELTLLAHSESVERNGLILLFVQKGTMELINPVEIKRQIL